jgi:DNA-binding NarL/FixJ family response regulator
LGHIDITPQQVLLADAHSCCRLGMHTLLTEAGFEIIGEIGRWNEIVPALQKQTPDILLLACNLFPDPHKSFISHLSHITSKTSIVLLVGRKEDHQIRNLMVNGVKGIVGKGESTATLLQALRAVAAGNLSFSENILEKVLAEENQADESSEFALNEQEKTILKLICAEKTNREMACIFVVSEKAIEKQLATLYSKLGVRSRVGAAIWATNYALDEKK